MNHITNQNRLRKACVCMLLRVLCIVFMYITCFPSIIGAQTFNKSTGKADMLWPLVETQLQKKDTSFHFISLLVRGHCGQDLDCAYDVSEQLVYKLEAVFNLPAAIFVCNELAKIAKESNDLNKEGHAFLNLYRFHDALGNKPSAAKAMEKAQKLFEKSGNQRYLMRCKITKIEESVGYLPFEKVHTALLDILEKAKVANDSTIILNLHSRLIMYTRNAGLFEESYQHVEALERLSPQSNPIKKQEYGYLIIAPRARAKLAMVENNPKKAERYYAQALGLAEAEPSLWLEIDILLSLADIKKEQSNLTMFESYTEKAHQKATDLKLDEFLRITYASKSEIAERRGEYKEALQFKKKAIFHDEKFESQSSGYDVRAYHLELEKEKWKAEKTLNETEIRLKDSKINFFLALLACILIVVTGLFLAYAYQKRSTEKLAAQYKVIQTQSESLQNLDAAKSRFFANVSHELRTPLTLMTGPISTLLKENKLTPRQVKLLKMANRSGNQLQSLITEILDLSKLEASKMEISNETINLRSFLILHLSQFDSLAKRKEVNFSFSVSFSDQLVALIDTSKYRQILSNLLSNAFKFTSAGGFVKADILLKNECLNLRISDSGQGIHPEDLPHLFERYFQTNQKGKSAIGGTGIGLSLCNEYVKLMGGTIGVESTLGEGTLFEISLPISIVSTNKSSEFQLSSLEDSKHRPQPEIFSTLPAASAHNQSQTQQPKSTILLVEDNYELQSYIKLLLSKKYSILTANHGQEALGILQKNKDIKLILSDLMMPVMDGYQLLDRLKKQNSTRHIPVVMLTARAEAKDKMKALRLGVDDYLMKPFVEDELLVRIENLLQNQIDRQLFVRTESAESTIEEVSFEDQKWLQEFEFYIRTHLSETNLNVPQIAHEFAMSESSLLRKLKRLSGLTVVKYIKEARLNEARQLIENRTSLGIYQLAKKVGYSDSRNFSRSFKKRFGRLPSEV